MDILSVLGGLVCVGAVVTALVWMIWKISTSPDRGRVETLERSIHLLSQRVATLERERRAAATTTAVEAPPPAQRVETASAPPSPERQPSAFVEAPRVGAPAADVPPPLPAAPPPAASPLPSPWAGRRPEVSLESFLGGRVMLIVGVVVGLLGIAFFLKHAIDQGWIGPGARIAIGCVAGVLLLLGGDSARRRGYDVFGQALSGCGLGALYLSNYFAATKYGFVGEGASFVAAATITAAGAALAVWRNAPVLAHLGFLGGWLAPALLATPTGELGGVTTWLIVLDAGVIAVLVLRPWRGLDLTALIASVVYFAAWFDRFGGRGDAVAHAGCVGALTAAALLASLAPSIVRRAKPVELSLIAAAGAGVFGVAGATSLLFPQWRWHLGVAVLALGACYFLASRLVASRVEGARGESEALLAFAAASLAAAVAVALKGAAVAPALSGAGVAVVYAGARTRHGVLLVMGVLTVALGMGDLLVNRLDAFDHAATPFLSERFAVFASPCVALFVCGKLIEKFEGAATASAPLVAALGFCALPILVAADMMSGTTGHADGRFELRIAAATVVLAVYGACVARAFAPGRAGAARTLAFAPVAMATAFGVWLLFEGHRTPFTPVASAAFLAGLVLVGAGVYAASLAGPSVAEVLRVVPLLYLLALITAELHAWGENRPLAADLTRKEAQFVATVWISIAWAVYAAALVGVGFWRKAASLRWVGLVVFALTLLKVFLVDMAELETVYRIGSFLALGALLIAASFLYQRARRSSPDA